MVERHLARSRCSICRCQNGELSRHAATTSVVASDPHESGGRCRRGRRVSWVPAWVETELQSPSCTFPLDGPRLPALSPLLTYRGREGGEKKKGNGGKLGSPVLFIFY